jgi:hypothetical protein
MAVHVFSRPATHRQPTTPEAFGPSPRAAVAWLVGGAVVTFAVSLIASDLAGLHHDLYLLIYSTIALSSLAWFVAASGVAWRQVLRSNLWWSLAIGVLVAVAVVGQAMDQAGTAHPGGAYFVFELVWRGVVYGAVDTLVLAVFPAVVAYLLNSTTSAANATSRRAPVRSPRSTGRCGRRARDGAHVRSRASVLRRGEPLPAARVDLGLPAARRRRRRPGDRRRLAGSGRARPRPHARAGRAPPREGDLR